MKKRRVQMVHDVPERFDTSDEEEYESPALSHLMSPSLASSQASSLVAPSVKGFSSPLHLQDLSPIVSTNSGALDALDGWSLGSNLYFSDTGSGAGFLESQGSTVEEGHGTAASLDISLQYGKVPPKKAKNVASSLGAMKSASVEKSKPVSSRRHLDVESDDVAASSGIQSSLNIADDKSQDDEGMEIVLDSVRKKKRKRRSRRLVSSNKISRQVTDTESSSGSSDGDLFAASGKLTISSSSQSSLEVNVSLSPLRMLSPPKKPRLRLRIKRKDEVLATQATQFAKGNNGSASETSQNFDTTKRTDNATQKKKDDKKTCLISDKSKQHDDKKLEKISITSGIKSSTNVEKIQPKTSLSRNKNTNSVSQGEQLKSHGNVIDLNSFSSGSSQSPPDEMLKDKDCVSNTVAQISEPIKDIKDMNTISSLPMNKLHDTSSKTKAVQSSEKSKQRDDDKQEKCREKGKMKSGIKASQTVKKLGPDAEKRNTATKDVEETAAKASGNKAFSSDSLSFVGGDEDDRWNEDLKKFQKLIGRKRDDNGSAKSGVGSLSTSAVRETRDLDDAGRNVDCKKVVKTTSAIKGLSLLKTAPVEKKKEKKKVEVKGKRGETAEEGAILGLATDPGQPTMGTRVGDETTEKTPVDDGGTKGADDGKTKGADDGKTKGADDGKTKGADDGKTKTVDDGRSRSPNLFEYESDSMLAPSSLLTRNRKVKGSADRGNKNRLNLTESGKTFSSEKSGTQPKFAKTSQTIRKSRSILSSSKSLLTDSGIASTPSSVTLASWPGLAKLKTSTPLEQYRSIVGLDKPKKGGAKKLGKRARDSGNDSDFAVESNISSMLSPVQPAPSVGALDRGKGQMRASEAASRPGKVRAAGTVGKEVIRKALPTKSTAGGKSGAKKKKMDAVVQVLPSDNKVLKKKKDADETTKTAASVVGMADIKTRGPHKKRPENKDVISNEAQTRQLHVEERLLQDLDDIDENYALIIDE